VDPTVVVIIIIGVVAALGVGVFFFIRGRNKVDEAYYHFRCPKCKRRLRYQTRQVGHQGQCSNCGNGVLFPPVSQSID
jgi:hypothetical protein